jgi:hypothetical protein
MEEIRLEIKMTNRAVHDQDPATERQCQPTGPETASRTTPPTR